MARSAKNNPNSHFDPTQQLALNPVAGQDVPVGQFGASSPYYSDFRWQRQPAESIGFGRTFRVKERLTFQIRAEFYNIFNRLFYALRGDSWPNGLAGLAAVNPQTPTAHGNTYATSNPATTQAGLLSAGFGFVNWVNGGAGTPGAAQPRSGQLIARFTFLSSRFTPRATGPTG